jgi:hypothetical protein
MHGSPQTTCSVCPRSFDECARCSAAVHVVGEDLVPLAIPKLIQVDIVLAHDALLIIPKRQENASMLISNSLELGVRILNHSKLQATLDEQRSDDNSHVRKLTAQLLDHSTIRISVALSKTLLLEVVGSHVDVHSLEVGLMLLQKTHETLIHAILHIQDLVAANTEVENTRVLVDAQHSARGLEALYAAGA